jgi:CRP/FNR family transcriptional regulator, nitrogen fixation regulation protein
VGVEAQLFDQKIGVVRSYRRKSEIFREEDPANRVYEVISGTVCTCKMLEQGRRQIAGFYFAGDVLGLEAAGATNTLAAQAITDVKVRAVQKQTLRALAASDTGLSDRLLSLTARELARKQNLALFLSSESLERVIYFLIERNSMSRQDIGDYLAQSK